MLENLRDKRYKLERDWAIGSSLTNNYWISSKDMNPQGDLFGGTLLSYVDETIAMLCIKTTCRKCVTVAVKDVHFMKPVKIGDLLIITTTISKVGNTSLEVQFTCDRMNIHSTPEKVAEGVFVMVAIDEDNRPTSEWSEICRVQLSKENSEEPLQP